MKQDLKGKQVVVTGAASGIGRAIAEEAVSRGAQAILADVNDAKLEEAVKLLGPTAAAFSCDVSQHAQVEALARFALEHMGGCDLVFANAGIIASKRFVNYSPDTFDQIFGVNVRGAWSTASVFAQQMLKSGNGGRICFTGSEHSLGFQHAGVALYTASKHAVLGLAEVLRAEMPPEITVSVLCPGLTATLLGSVDKPAQSNLENQNTELQAMVQSKGMAAAEVAKAGVDGTLRGDFYLVTHSHTVLAAEQRYKEITDAFAEQAPPDRNGTLYEVGRVIEEIRSTLAT